MGGVIGLTMLVCVSTVGLVHLALRHTPLEHRLGTIIVGFIAFSLLGAAPFAAVLLLLSAGWTRRLVGTQRTPDVVPPHWV